MTPERLELSGFTAFREPTTVDFTGVELFALTGETGSGKSSLIDALTFALYGSVARYGRRGLVEPVISSGMNEARVRFDFELSGRRLTAVRVVRRTATGATTAEARLEERDGEVLASGSDEVTNAVTRLVGLGFSHFTRSVVLPQGEFARFLHDKPSDRQAFLKALLDLGILERVRDTAKQRLERARQESEIRTERLTALQFGTEAAEQEARAREKLLSTLVDDVGELVAGIESHENNTADVRRQMAGLQEDRDLVAGLEPPSGLVHIMDDLEAAEKRLATEADSMEKAAEELEEARRNRYELPKLTDVERMEQDQRLLEQLVTQRKDLVDPTAEAKAAEAEMEQAVQKMRSSSETWETTRLSNNAAAMLDGVSAGDPCPVCLRPLAELPQHSGQDELHLARAALEEAKQQQETARDQRDTVQKRLDLYQTSVRHLDERLEEVRARLRDHPEDPGTLRDRVEEADLRLAAAEKEHDRAKEAHQHGSDELTSAKKTAETAQSAFDEARFRLARLDPPQPDDADLPRRWEALSKWMGQKHDLLNSELAQMTTAVKELSQEAEEMTSGLRERFASEGVELEGDPKVSVARAHQGAVNEVQRIREARTEAGEIRDKVIELERDAEVARSLVGHLRANRFEGWLLDEALHTLANEANYLLTDLSSGNYLLDVEDREFIIIDRRNLDARRDVRTLSGGETFLVSLALALSLASQLGELATEGTAPLDAIFLDEGFGTLDGETLETVASVVTELSARGRVVGIVTHVRDLADRMPVRFVVTRDGSTARVSRDER